MLFWITFSPTKAHWCAFFLQQTLEESQASQLRGFSATRDTSQLLLQLCSLITGRAQGSGRVSLIFPYYTLKCDKLQCSNRNSALFTTLLSSHKPPSLKPVRMYCTFQSLGTTIFKRQSICCKKKQHSPFSCQILDFFMSPSKA